MSETDPLVLELRQRLYAAEDAIARLREVAQAADAVTDLIEIVGWTSERPVFISDTHAEQCVAVRALFTALEEWSFFLAATARADADTGGAGREARPEATSATETSGRE